MFIFIGVTLSCWTLLNLFDIMMKSCMVRPYLDYLRYYNLNVNLFRIKWYTTRLNRYFNGAMIYSKRRSRSLWFDVGVVATLVLSPVACFLLARTFFALLWEMLHTAADASDNASRSSSSGRASSPMDLTPVLPGINLPLSDLPFYISTLIICSVLHEFGHALAASREGVQINGVGAFLVVVFPGAYVDLPMDPLAALPLWRRLRIFCGGVWHNLVIAAVAWALLTVNPVLLSPLYREGVAVVTVDGTVSGGVDGPGGLWPGDEITAINQCPVASVADWESCLASYVVGSLPDGGCLPRNFVLGLALMESADGNLKHHDSAPGLSGNLSLRSCCSPGVESPTDLCFSLQSALKHDSLARRTCLPVRLSLDKVSQPCGNASDCSDPAYICAKPVLPHPSHRLLVVKRASVRQDMLFVGPPEEMWQAVRVVQYVPRSALPFLSAQTLFYWETLLRYLISFSGALAILNAVPCHALDGHWIAFVLVELVLGNSRPTFNRTVFNVITFAGTFVIGATVALGLRKLVYLM